MEARLCYAGRLCLKQPTKEYRQETGEEGETPVPVRRQSNKVKAEMARAKSVDNSSIPEAKACASKLHKSLVTASV